jgi:class 3 adenylate cyclase/CHASE2 domain-containing sensor protein
MSEFGSKKRFARNRFAALAVLTLISAGLVFALEQGGVLNTARYKAYDTMFYLRERIRPPKPFTDSPVVLVGIDDATFAAESFRIPQILWHRYFNTVIQGLADAGAKTVGLDFLLPQALFDDLVPDYSRTWLKTLVYARSKKAPVVSGLVQTPERQITPQARYLQIMGVPNIGLFNLTADDDDFIRRQRLFFPSADDPTQGLYSVTFLLAKNHTPDLELPGQSIFIDFNSSPHPFPRHSFAHVYEKAKQGDINYLKEHFQNKIVLIGETDTLTQDRHATPLYFLPHEGPKRTPGVEILAHTVLTILKGRHFSTVGLGGSAVLHVAMALVIGLLTLYASPRIPLWLSSPLAAIVYFSLCEWAFLEYLIMPLAGGLITWLISQGAFFSYRFWVVDREKREVRGAFSRYLSPDVVDEVLQNPDMLSLGGSRREMTAFFSDLAGFTSISEALSPEDLVHLLNRYLSLMTDIILRHGGTLDKFEGDAIMAFWGAPLPRNDHALKACLAALEQQEVMNRFRREVVDEGLPELHVRMGVNTGPMIVGNMGSEERFDYTIMGDAVNLASRLEGANKAYDTYIMISESTYAQVRDHVEVRELDLLRVKGKNEPIRVYELMAANGGLDDKRTKIRDAYVEGLELYRAQDFEAAIKAFKAALALDPDDGPSKVYVQRCRDYINDPPPAGWDGVYTLKTK